MPAVLAFTGTLKGTTKFQWQTLDDLLRSQESGTAVCHGVAIGADYEFHQLCRGYAMPICGFPGNIANKRADIPAQEFAILFPEKYPLVRNRDMVDYSKLYSNQYGFLIVCPKGEHEELRSGTWAAVRYARASAMNIAYIWPSDGALEFRKPGDPHYRSRYRHVEVQNGTGESTSSEAGS